VPLLGTLIVQTSRRGGFDAAGLAPLRYTDKRLRRPERSAALRPRRGDRELLRGQIRPR
jgi:hypothetical protein